MTDIDIALLDELAGAWDEIHEDYRTAKDDGYDRAVLDCAERLGTDPGIGSALVWTLGLVVMAPYLTWLPGEGVAPRAMAALRATDAALSGRVCDHASHPYLGHDSADDLCLTEMLGRLIDDTAEWDEERPRDEWRCPRNVGGFARIAMDIIEPGSATDVPPRLAVEAEGSIASLSALLNGYPDAWTDVNEEIACQGWNLSASGPADRAGHLMVVRAVTWYAVSGMVRAKWVLDDLVEAVESALPHFADASCDHDGHPTLPDSGPDAAELGVVLSSPGGRGVYEQGLQEGEGPALEWLLCPVFMTEIAEETLRTLRERREELFGSRDTSHADTEYLRADGRLEIEKIVERLDSKSWNERYADDLGLWAARRYEHADERERPVLLVTAHLALKTSYPSPPPSVVRDVLATMRAVATTARPQGCGHEDEHPTLKYAEIRPELPHFYAPDEHPPAADPRSTQAWVCPQFARAVAEECIRDLEALDEDETDDCEAMLN
ncbi:hypothetical protein [Streptomyces sp. NPDC058382]|uniref:hypothetical protein n=1 Tax=unclassified Streptomyces TaxID=2593676 RepID=UPI00363BFF2D